MRRSCARPGCADRAVATLSYDHAATTVWVDELVEEPILMTHDLSDRHADGLVVPRGWALDDQRSGEIGRPGDELAS